VIFVPSCQPVFVQSSIGISDRCARVIVGTEQPSRSAKYGLPISHNSQADRVLVQEAKIREVIEEQFGGIGEVWFFLRTSCRRCTASSAQ